MATKGKSKGRFVIVGHSTWGIKYGTLEEPIQTALSRGSCVLRDGGGIYVYATGHDKGGVDTLAAVGPRAEGSRIGKAVAQLGVAEIKAIYVCSPEAAAKFAPFMR